jgi:ribonuclease VapC
MVVDSSAIVAILENEPLGRELGTALANAEDPMVSAATMVEACIVLGARVGTAGDEIVDTLLWEAGVRCVAVDVQQMNLAREAWLAFGKGRHPAALNYGDCFSYALAKATDRPLLYKGDDFAQTDVVSALASPPG